MIYEAKEELLQKDLYIVLSSSSSVPAKLIKAFTKNNLNHSSITLDTSLHAMYSFGRLKMYNAFYGGFVREDKDKGFYQKFTDTYIKLYRLKVPEGTFEEVKSYLENAYINKKSFKYNFLGVVLAPFKIPIARENQYFCSEFVAMVIKRFKVREINRNIHLYRPYYFEELSDIELLYEGMLKDYSHEALEVSEVAEEETREAALA